MTTWDTYFAEKKELLGKRANTFEAIFNCFLALDHPPIIVETGTYREENNYTGDGCSTLLFDNYVDIHGGKLFSVDIDPDACDLAAKATKHANIIESDSVEYLGSLDGECDLLYLDSFNIQDWLNDWEPAAHHLKELFAAKNILRDGTLIVIDDNLTLPSGKRVGKGRLVYELMDSLGIEPLFDSYQVGWLWQECV
jgi:predicted O-methyltransferase YrrM